MVQRLASGTRGNLLVVVCRRHGPGPVRAAAGHLGQFSTVPDPKRLLAHGRQLEERPLSPTLAGHFCPAGRAIRRPNGVVHCPVHPQGFREGAMGEQRVS